VAPVHLAGFARSGQRFRSRAAKRLAGVIAVREASEVERAVYDAGGLARRGPHA
jgi:hypothetical protein